MLHCFFFLIAHVFHFALYEYQVDDMTLGGVIDRGCARIQRGFNRLETWVNENLMKLIQGKCKVLDQSRNT